MKLKHNKKRNTAFLYETLIVELTKATITENNQKRETILNILNKYFKNGKVLRQELELYNAINETQDLESKMAEKLILEAKRQYAFFNHQHIFDQQTDLIKTINKSLNKDVFNNFVPDYKNLATIAQMLNVGTPIKRKVILEQKLVEKLTSRSSQTEDKMQPIDNLVYKTFVSKFNEHYTELHDEQKQLLEKYIFSFSDNGVSLKMYLNEEISRLRDEIKNSLSIKEIKEDTDMNKSTKDVLSLMESFSSQPVDIVLVKKVLKIQNLVREINN